MILPVFSLAILTAAGPAIVASSDASTFASAYANSGSGALPGVELRTCAARTKRGGGTSDTTMDNRATHLSRRISRRHPARHRPRLLRGTVLLWRQMVRGQCRHSPPLQAVGSHAHQGNGLEDNGNL